MLGALTAEEARNSSHTPVLVAVALGGPHSRSVSSYQAMNVDAGRPPGWTISCDVRIRMCSEPSPTATVIAPTTPLTEPAAVTAGWISSLSWTADWRGAAGRTGG